MTHVYGPLMPRLCPNVSIQCMACSCASYALLSVFHRRQTKIILKRYEIWRWNWLILRKEFSNCLAPTRTSDVDCRVRTKRIRNVAMFSRNSSYTNGQ